jgi:ACS family glucarate transporter-like MFS transporter
MEGRRVRVKYQHRVLGLLSLLSIITYIDRVCIGVAGPRMQDALHISPQAWGWVASVFFLSYSAFEIPTGALGDRIGPRRVLTRIVLWWSAFTSLTGAVSSYSLLLVVRFCFGMGEAGAYPNAAAVIGRWIPPLQRTRAWGIVWMTGQIGAAISPLLVLPIQARYGWRASFFLFGFLGVIWAAVWYAWFRDSPLEKAGITPGELEEIGPPLVVRHGGLPWSRTLRQPTFWTFATIGASYVYTLGFFQAWLQTYLVRGHGYSDAALALSSLTYVLGACANVTGGFVGDWLVRRFGLTKGRRTLGVRPVYGGLLHVGDGGGPEWHVGARLPLDRLRGNPAATAEPLRGQPGHRPPACGRRVRLHEYSGEPGLSGLVGAVWLHRGGHRQLRRAVDPDGGRALRWNLAVVSDRSDAAAV